ncbi:MAG: hypothetical protein ACI8PZ_000338 [Myxococcota bacterium]|jgi:hypothetical protein
MRDLADLLNDRGFSVLPITPSGPFGGFRDAEPALLWERQLRAAGLPVVGRCHGVAQTRVGAGLCLAYSIEGRLVLGGPPCGDPRLAPDDVAAAVPVPPELARVYAVHDGLGPADGPRAVWWRASILPTAHTRVLTRHMRFGEDDILYDPAAHVLVTSDGAGGGWCVDREGRARSWDRQTHALGARTSLADALGQVANAWIVT